MYMEDPSTISAISGAINCALLAISGSIKESGTSKLLDREIMKNKVKQ